MIRTHQLTDVPLRDLVPEKVTIAWIRGQDHSRWVLRTRKNRDATGRFYKIWNPSYVRRDNILSAVEAGFYDDRTTPALDGLLICRGICRGYVMRIGVPNRRLNPDFFDLVAARTRETGYFQVQFSASHTMLCDGQASLLDLEAVWPLADYPRFRSDFENHDYERFVAKLYHETYPGTRFSTTKSRHDCSERKPAYGNGGLAGFLERLRAKSARVRQQLFIRMHNFRPRIELIEL